MHIGGADLTVRFEELIICVRKYKRLRFGFHCDEKLPFSSAKCYLKLVERLFWERGVGRPLKNATEAQAQITVRFDGIFVRKT